MITVADRATGRVRRAGCLQKASAAATGYDRLFGAAPASRKLLERAAARGSNLGALTAGLLHLLERYGARNCRPR